MLVLDKTWELMQFETLPLLVMCVIPFFFFLFFLFFNFLFFFGSAWVDRYL